MDNLKLYCLIYELKGVVKSLSEMADQDENYNNPVIEVLEEKMKEVMGEVEKKVS